MKHSEIPTEFSVWEHLVSAMVVFHLWNEKKKKNLSGHSALLNQTNVCSPHNHWKAQNEIYG